MELNKLNRKINYSDVIWEFLAFLLRFRDVKMGPGAYKKLHNFAVIIAARDVGRYAVK